MVAVLAIVGVVAGVGLSSGGAAAAPRTPVPAALANSLTHVPLGNLVAVSARVGQLQPARGLTGNPLTAAGKPELLYIGAEFCPICAAERWPLVVALSHFGTFSNLAQTRSAVRDGNIATFSFYGSSFASPYLTFTPVETTTNQPQGNYYKPLEQPTPVQTSLWTTLLGGQQSFPFIDIGGKYLLTTSQYSAATLEGLSFTGIANAVASNSNPVGVDINASAAALIKYICGVTGNQPAATCGAVASVNAPVAATSAGPSSSAG